MFNRKMCGVKLKASCGVLPPLQAPWSKVSMSFVALLLNDAQGWVAEHISDFLQHLFPPTGLFFS